MNPFTVDIVGAADTVQMAYAVNQDNFNIIIGKSGHAALIRRMDKHDFQGGWIFIKSHKITFYSGFLGPVTHNKEMIKESIELKLRLYLKEVK
jgi:hypothetical protein